MNTTLAKRAGRQAWFDGVSFSACPYKGLLGAAWRTGWIERDAHA